MGTSTAYKGPVDRADAGTRRWKRARRRLTKLGDDLDSQLRGPGGINGARRLLENQQDDLADDLIAALHAFPERELLVPPLIDQANAVVEALNRLREGGVAAIGIDADRSADERELQFIAALLAGVPPDTVSKAAARNGARRAAESALRRDPALRHAVRSADPVYRLPRGLFCAIFQLFFAEAVRGFLEAIVAEHLKAALPVLYLDPTGMIADAAAKKLVSLVPSPCEEQRQVPGADESIAQTARSLIRPAVSGILNLDESSVEAA